MRGCASGWRCRRAQPRTSIPNTTRRPGAAFIQHYRVRDYPDYAAATGQPDGVGIDYAIGQPELSRHGLGPQLIWAYLRDVVLAAQPDARTALASPDRANAASIRALEKAGFRQAGPITITGQPAAEQLCLLDLLRFFSGNARAG